MWEASLAFHICIAYSLPELLRRLIAQRTVRTFRVILRLLLTVFTPASCCFKIPIICSSMYWLFFIPILPSTYERTPASTGRVFGEQVRTASEPTYSRALSMWAVSQAGNRRWLGSKPDPKCSSLCRS